MISWNSLFNMIISAGYLVSCACPNLDVCLNILPMVMIPFMVFGGFFLNAEYVFTSQAQ
jgi:hypothetical protein